MQPAFFRNHMLIAWYFVLTGRVMMVAHHVLVAFWGAQSHLVDELKGRFERAVLGDVEVEPGTTSQRRGVPPGYVPCKHSAPLLRLGLRAYATWLTSHRRAEIKVTCTHVLQTKATRHLKADSSSSSEISSVICDQFLFSKRQNYPYRAHTVLAVGICPFVKVSCCYGTRKVITVTTGAHRQNFPESVDSN